MFNFQFNILNFLRTAIFLLFALTILITPAISYGQKSSNRGGGPNPTQTPVNPLPQTPPAPDVLYRESFGFADLFRPAGGKGQMKDIFAHQNIRNFWLEYPGSKSTQWLAPDAVETWRFCGGSDNPYEMSSPIQITLMANAAELLLEGPSIEKIDVLAAKAFTNQRAESSVA